MAICSADGAPAEPPMTAACRSPAHRAGTHEHRPEPPPMRRPAWGCEGSRNATWRSRGCLAGPAGSRRQYPGRDHSRCREQPATAHRFRSLGSIGPQGVSNSPLPCAARARARCKSLPNHEPVRSAAPTSARANTARTPWRVKIFKTTRRGRRAPESDSRAGAAKGHHSEARRPNPGAARAHEGAAHRCCPIWSPTPSQSPTATVASACTRVVNAYQITLL